MKKVTLGVYLILVTFIVHAQEIKYQLVENIGYYNQETQNSDDYIKERCKLDVHYPKDTLNVPTVVWFHEEDLSLAKNIFPKA